jgi:hypothetical protein
MEGELGCHIAFHGSAPEEFEKEPVHAFLLNRLGYRLRN